ncbi:type I CRISPR-associated protein Cas7 [Thermonema rossianum]|uniref:type I CRISPR-associated protein Cas7 n=1 Tax=Thermonema rossianum TaxID=55505 RepID=UPI000571026F|nr:type I CRISPR-associated protein Cas7 [Thermonema rossianum]
MAKEFKNRVYGFALVRSLNSNYNADFTHQPRTLPNGVVYATDKAFKFAVKHYLVKEYPVEKILYFKKWKEDFVPMSLEEAYESTFPEDKDKNKETVAYNLLSCLDVRTFGATFAMKGSENTNVAISIHGPVQVNHGINIWIENNIFTEQISSPFRNPNERSVDNTATTLGRQSKLEEGHYLHHFSINPHNLHPIVQILDEDAPVLTHEDIQKIKEAFRVGVSYYQSAQKAGTDNEALLWVTLKEGSKRVLPNFTPLVSLSKKEDGKLIIDCSKVANILDQNKDQIESVEIYYLPEQSEVKDLPQEKAKHFNLINGQEIKETSQ